MITLLSIRHTQKSGAKSSKMNKVLTFTFIFNPIDIGVLRLVVILRGDDTSHSLHCGKFYFEV